MDPAPADHLPSVCLHGGSVRPPQVTIPVTSCQPQGLDEMTARGGAVDQANEKTKPRGSEQWANKPLSAET